MIILGHRVAAFAPLLTSCTHGNFADFLSVLVGNRYPALKSRKPGSVNPVALPVSAKAISWESVHQTICPKASDYDRGGADFLGLAPVRPARQTRLGNMLKATKFHLPDDRAAPSDLVRRRLSYLRMTHGNTLYITNGV
ncbi:MAG: hypothetical protein QOF90_676 [Acetobacteraceae bacterium]|nr:hypothetical protein [Acetobacteraceae bacterium]